uniref:Uncharacterized protein n=1 Tax=Anguilla anguilla TaxID=7936 RepID=A0A0E9WE54_ANGAN
MKADSQRITDGDSTRPALPGNGSSHTLFLCDIIVHISPPPPLPFSWGTVSSQDAMQHHLT